ncbi:MAG: glycerol-3-phosphate 1-O-acyltransferase PlsY [Clostridia bacterium]|nr:glycerol-3-phosphate 1-O-acyltransferase PlsY [Clostridia bacterium]
MEQLFILVLAYILGAIPVGYLVGTYWKKIDIRHYGSGNIGTTNAFRILGVGPALVVLGGDLFKGVIPTYLALQYGSPVLGVVAGLLTMAGHNWSVFLGFKGGRGVATGAGVVLALTPQILFIALMVFIIVAAISRYVSLASILGALIVPILLIYFREPLPFILFGLVASTFVILRHIPNMKRLAAGTEFKLGQKTSKHEGRK